MHKVLIFSIAAVIIVSIGGVYATSTVGQAGTTGCTGEMVISPPTSNPATIGWMLNGSGELEAVEVAWTPDYSSDYNLVVAVGGSTGLLSISGSGTIARRDVVPVSPPVGAEVMDSITLTITENITSPTGTAVTVGWKLNGAGQVTAAEVRWAPDKNGDYTLVVTVEGSTGSRTITDSGTSTRTDTVLIMPKVDPEVASSASLCINEV